ncbi:MAG: PadR family transcriptional regulator [Promethearchaeati archaeon SRVP18_Atabeyarchaeia-1]
MFWSGRGFGRGVWSERISPVEFLILILLKEEPTHGYDIMQRLAEKFSGLWSPKAGTVYPALTRLEERDLIRLKEPKGTGPENKGEADYPPKKVYILTEKGAEALKNIIEKMDHEEKFISRFMGVVDQSVWQSFDDLAFKRIQGAVEKALDGASHALRFAMQMLPIDESIRELEFYREQLKVELDRIEKKLSEMREKEKKFRKVEVE